MPLVFEKEDKNKYRLALWKVTESYEELKQQTTAPDHRVTKYHDIKLDKRKIEWIGRSFLYDYMNIEELSYLENGKPVLDEGYISISHCDDLVCMITSSYPIGLDVQNPQLILERIAPKFCGPEELRWIETLDDKLDALSLIWSAKEAVFKVYGEDVPFAEGMRIFLNKGFENGRCLLNTPNYKEDIPITIEKVRDYYLVYNEEF